MSTLSPLDLRVAFDAPGKVTVRTGKVELGQGILAALIKIAADSLDVSPDRVVIPPTSTNASPNEGHTAGSFSVQTSGVATGQACRQARMLLTAAAAAKLNVAPDKLQVQDGKFLCDAADTGLDYWSVADALVGVSFEPDFAPPAKGGAAKGDVGRADLRAKITGGAYIQDMELPGMLHARVVRPPEHGARFVALDAKAFAEENAGVQVIADGDFVAVVCALEEDAVRAADRLRSFAHWRLPNSTGLLGEVADWLPPLAPPGAAPTAPNVEGLDWHRATYSRGAIAHGSIGPSCAVAQATGGRLEIWTHSQSVFALRDSVAAALQLDAASIDVTHVPAAGCYGHNGADDAGFEAAFLAMRLPGVPVRVQWSREEELAWAPVGAPMVVQIDAGLTPDGMIGAWALELWTAPHARRPGVGGVNLLSASMLEIPTPIQPATEIPLAFGGGGDRNALAIYDLPDQRITSHFVSDLPIRTSSLRALGGHCNVFAIESMMDELAERAGADPLEFRLRHLTDSRARRVLEAVTKMSNWGTPAPDGEGRGLAMARYKNTGGYAAIVADVEVGDEVIPKRVWCAIDVGQVVTPDGVINQIEGGIIQSLSWALREAAPLNARGVEAKGWKDYPILRFSETPEIFVELVGDQSDPPVGAGEVVQGPATAAAANAVAAALGARLRRLPMTRDRIITALST